MSRYLLSLDQGTTSSRAVLFTPQGQLVAMQQQEFAQHFPQSGWVEHNPDDIWHTTLSSLNALLKTAEVMASDIIAAGITNQRETTLIWDRATGEPIYNAIVWQDRRTADFCQTMRTQISRDNTSIETFLHERTGLVLDPYFSATKIVWILDNVPEARARAERGELVFGTVDTFLLWRLTEGRVHATDATNAARTLLFNIHSQNWDEELLELFNIPKALLPEVKDSAAHFGEISTRLLAEAGNAPITIGGVAGDQQAALVGQACFTAGMAKSTYGTGCFMMMNTGNKALISTHRLLTTVAYRINGEPTYALEGSIFMAGATVQWIRDGLRLITNAGDTQLMAEETGYENPVYMVPAFTGLGAPYWDPEARGAIFGLSRDTGIKEVVTAGLQAVCYQTRDLIEAMHKDGVELQELRVDGGMVVNNWLVQFLADILGIPIARPQVTETTALGVALLAGLHSGVYKNTDEMAQVWSHNQAYASLLSTKRRDALYQGWLEAVQRVRSDLS